MRKNYADNLSETLSKLKELYQEIAEISFNRDAAIANAFSKAEQTATKALYRDALAPLREEATRLRIKLQRINRAMSTPRAASISDSLSIKLFNKRLCELTPSEKRAYNRFCQRRSRLRREMGGD